MIEQQTLSGAEFERIVSRRLDKARQLGLADVRRCGVHAVMKGPGNWQVIPSRPDFEGLLPGPRPIVFDCKVCSGASMDLASYRGGPKETSGNRKHQLQYMFDKAEYGAVCFFLIHWNRRELETKKEEAITYVFPVHAETEFWVRFTEGEIKRLYRSDCEELGQVVPWNLFGKLDRIAQPDVLSVL